MLKQEKKVEAAVEKIEYEKDGQWGGYNLTRRRDGLWIFGVWSAISGRMSGRVVLLQAPDWLEIKDAADLDTDCDGMTKAERLIAYGREVRCVCRGYRVQ